MEIGLKTRENKTLAQYNQDSRDFPKQLKIDVWKLDMVFPVLLGFMPIMGCLSMGVFRFSMKLTRLFKKSVSSLVFRRARAAATSFLTPFLKGGAAVERESLEESEPPSESEARLPAFPDLGSARIRVIFLLRGRPFNFGAVTTNKL